MHDFDGRMMEINNRRELESIFRDWYTITITITIIPAQIFMIFDIQLISYKRYLECFNGDYLSIPEGTGSCGYLFHEIPGTSILCIPNPVVMYSNSGKMASVLPTQHFSLEFR